VHARAAATFGTFRRYWGVTVDGPELGVYPPGVVVDDWVEVPSQSSD
jgi:hypothetical protein